MEDLMNIKELTLTIYTRTLLTQNRLLLMKDKIYIYESPDKGKTIYRREFGNYDKKELIKSSDSE